jgi:CRP/FNR family nitrogen fixation transcriptional regulator
MLLQTPATIQNQRSIGGAVLAGIENCLFADCPELLGAKLSYRRDEEIYGEAEEAEFVYKVMSGAVRTYKLLSDGRRQIGAFLLPGDLFGFESSTTHRLTAEAVADATVLVFKRRTLEHFAMRNIEVARQLWSLAARNLDHAEDHMLLLGRKTAAERVAAFLLEMDGRMQSTGAISLPMTRRDIADYLGMTLETVSRTMSQLQAEGTLELSTARQITVQRRSKLRALGSEELNLDSWPTGNRIRESF